MIIKTLKENGGYGIVFREDNDKEGKFIPIFIDKKDFKWEEVGKWITWGLKKHKEKYGIQTNS